MFADHSLMPREILRLAALGMLAEGQATYGALATAVRGFISAIMGPSPQTMGSSLELLRYEGLVQQETPDGAEPVLHLTAKGRAEFNRLMQATVRSPFDDFNKLVVALKMRFLPLLAPQARREQADILAEACRTEVARLLDLRARNTGRPGPFHAWLDHDIIQAEARLAWFESLGRQLVPDNLASDSPAPATKE